MVFVSGLWGGPGKYVRLQVSDMATVATQAQHSEWETMREAKEDRRTVFTVRGYRLSMRDGYKAPRWKSQ